VSPCKFVSGLATITVSRTGMQWREQGAKSISPQASPSKLAIAKRAMRRRFLHAIWIGST
jgi:hypothetical protein